MGVGGGGWWIYQYAMYILFVVQLWIPFVVTGERLNGPSLFMQDEDRASLGNDIPVKSVHADAHTCKSINVDTFPNVS